MKILCTNAFAEICSMNDKISEFSRSELAAMLLYYFYILLNNAFAGFHKLVIYVAILHFVA